MKEKIERIEQLEKELAELKADLLKQPEKWQDKLVQPKDNRYYFITSAFDKGLQVSAGDGFKRRKPEHAFATVEQAELVKEKMLLMQEMFAFAHVRNEGWMPDWDNGKQIKWGLNVYKNTTEVDTRTYYNGLVFGIAVKSKEIVEEMLDEFGERIKEIYNKQY